MSQVVEEVRLNLPHIELAAHLFGPEDGLPVIAADGREVRLRTTLGALLPHSFGPDHLTQGHTP